MQILHVISSCAPGGAETFVLDLACKQQEMGNEVAVAYISSARDHGSDPAFERDFLLRLERAKVRHFELGHPARRHPVRGAIALRRCMAEFEPDVLHSHLASGLAFRLLLRRPTLRTLYTHHLGAPTFPSLLFKLFDRVVDRYISICRTSEEVMRPHVRRPITRIYNGIAPERVPYVAPKVLDGKLRILSVASLTERKDHATLIRAIELLRTSGRCTLPISVSIAGEGPERARLEKLIEARQVSDTVTLLGARRDIGALMLHSDLFVMTSRMEGLPMALIEAQHAGMPIICTDVGGCGEIVEHGKNGYLIQPGDPHQLAALIEGLLSQPALIEELSLSAREASARFSIGQVAQQHLRAYEETLSPRVA